jgi:hypothetical protein
MVGVDVPKPLFVKKKKKKNLIFLGSCCSLLFPNDRMAKSPTYVGGRLSRSISFTVKELNSSP